VSRRFALVAAFAAALLLPGTAWAASATVTVSGNTRAFSGGSPTIDLGGTVAWQTFATTVKHTTTADKFAMWSYELPIGNSTSPSVEFDRAGGFAYHCQIHPGMRGTVLVRMWAEDTTPVIGQMITIHFAMSAAPSGYSEQIQKRKVGGTWANFSVGNTGATVTWTPKKARTFQFQARLVNGSQTSNWSPVLQLTVTAH
jgi:plastocyanin